MKIKSYVGEYEADFYSDFSFASEIGALANKFFVVDEKVHSLYQKEIDGMTEGQPCYYVEAVETNKNIETALKIISRMVELSSKRNTTLVAIGGGIVQDLSAFVANVLYRGINWVLVPTTLLAQADSCIGSKSSLNYAHYKNLLGYFYPPTRIFVNTGFLKSLEEKEYKSGFGEMVKCAIMAGKDSFLSTSDHLKKIFVSQGGMDKLIIEEIQKALAFKKAVIEEDEFDRGYRNIMNFGHTFGHALESTSDYAIPHGQAVSIGIMIANEVARSRKLMTEDYQQQIADTIKGIVSMELLRRDYFGDAYLTALKKDKKYTGKSHACILASAEGVKKYADVTDDEVMAAVDRFWQGLGGR